MNALYYRLPRKDKICDFNQIIYALYKNIQTTVKQK